MGRELTISTELLRTTASALIDHLEDTVGRSLSLDVDYFWQIPKQERFNPYQEPTGFTLGQLSDCADNLSGIASDPSTATSYGLVWLAELLKAVGEDVVQ